MDLVTEIKTDKVFLKSNDYLVYKARSMVESFNSPAKPPEIEQPKPEVSIKSKLPKIARFINWNKESVCIHHQDLNIPARFIPIILDLFSEFYIQTGPLITDNSQFFRQALIKDYLDNLDAFTPKRREGEIQDVIDYLIGVGLIKNFDVKIIDISPFFKQLLDMNGRK
jgi:hypothetical protein